MPHNKPTAFIAGRLFNASLILLLLSNGCHGDVELFRAACPYTKFCTTDSLEESPQTDEARCCLDCFCDDACHAYADCCPDVYDVKRSNVTDVVQCESVIAATEYAFQDHGSSANSYRMITTCPANYTDTDGTVEKCEEKIYNVNRSYADTVTVSGPNNVIYRNNFCALCNGLVDATKWTLIVPICRDKFENLRLQASEVKPYVMKNCILESVRPPTLVLNSRLLSCRREIVSECTDNVTISGAISDEIIDGCETGPYMPYAGGAVYKNALCFLCNGFEEGDSQCFDVLNTGTRAPVRGLTELLNMDPAPRVPKWEHECGESQIMDKYTGECSNLYCPPYEAVYYGRCLRIAETTRKTLLIRTVYWPDDEIILQRPFRFYNDSMAAHYARKVRDVFKALSCPGITVYVQVVREPGTDKLIHLLVESLVGTDERKCTMKGVANVIRRRASFWEVWLIDDDMVMMKGQHSFFRSATEDDSNGLGDFLVYDRNMNVGMISSDVFFVCPYLEVDMNWYNALLVKEGHSLDGTGNLTTLSEKTETVEGVFVLSESVLAVCADRFLSVASNSQSSTIVSCTSQALLVLSWLLVDVMINYIE